MLGKRRLAILAEIRGDLGDVDWSGDILGATSFAVGVDSKTELRDAL